MQLKITDEDSKNEHMKNQQQQQQQVRLLSFVIGVIGVYGVYGDVWAMVLQTQNQILSQISIIVEVICTISF